MASHLYRIGRITQLKSTCCYGSRCLGFIHIRYITLVAICWWISWRKPWFILRHVHEGSTVYKGALESFICPSNSVFHCPHHSTIAPHSSIHLPPTLYNFFLPVLQFSPVSIIPPLLHTHPSIYHPHSIMFFSQYFSFSLTVSFQLCSIPIHPSTTHAV